MDGVENNLKVKKKMADLLFRGRLPEQNGLLELQDKAVPSKVSICRVLPASCQKGRFNGPHGGENGRVKLRPTWS